MKTVLFLTKYFIIYNIIFNRLQADCFKEDFCNDIPSSEYSDKKMLHGLDRRPCSDLKKEREQ